MFAYKVNDAFSIGVDVSVQKIAAKLTNSAGAAGVATLKADDISFGFNVGVVFQPSPATRIGMHYRSAIQYDVEGSVTFSSAAANAANAVSATAALKVPDSFSLSVAHVVKAKWDVMGDLKWTGWDKLQRLTVVRASSSGVPFSGGNLLGGTAATVFNTLEF